MRKFKNLLLALVIMLSVIILSNYVNTNMVAKLTSPNTNPVYTAELRIIDPPPVLSQGYMF